MNSLNEYYKFITYHKSFYFTFRILLKQTTNYCAWRNFLIYLENTQVYAKHFIVKISLDVLKILISLFSSPILSFCNFSNDSVKELNPLFTKYESPWKQNKETRRKEVLMCSRRFFKVGASSGVNICLLLLGCIVDILLGSQEHCTQFRDSHLVNVGRLSK